MEELTKLKATDYIVIFWSVTGLHSELNSSLPIATPVGGRHRKMAHKGKHNTVTHVRARTHALRSEVQYSNHQGTSCPTKLFFLILSTK